MNKKDFVYLVSKNSKIPFDVCEKVLSFAKSTILQVCLKGENITLRGFGKFQVKNRDSRNFVNPQTKRYYLFKSKRIVYFKGVDNLF